MMDCMGEMETRNYGIKRVTDKRIVWELLWATLSLAMVAGALSFHSWVHGQMINMGYESQKLLTTEKSLLRTQKSLILEEETLKSPERIDGIARNELGMTPLRPNQIIPPMFLNVEQGSPNTVAMVNPSVTELKKPTAHN